LGTRGIFIRKESAPDMFKRLCFLSSCILIAATLHAQSSQSAERSPLSLWVGGEFSTFNPDWGCGSNSPFSCGGGQLMGIGTFGDINHIVFARLGAEAEGRFLHWGGPVDGISQDSYLFGPRFVLFRTKMLVFNGKVLVGGGHVNLTQNEKGTGSYLVYAPGAIAEFRVNRRWSARVEYEYQLWPGFEGVPTATTSGTGGITPNGFSFGFSYALLR
jgi:hypothetical protein